MRTLDPFIIIKSTILLMTTLFLCSVNIYFFLRHKRNLFITGFHVSSLFVLCGLFCLMMDNVIIGLPFKVSYTTAAHISFALCILSIAVFSTLALADRIRNPLGYQIFSPNLEAVFSGICDLALVVDYRGNIIQINHPEIIQSIYPNPATLMELLLFFKKIHHGEWPFPDEISAIDEEVQCELFFQEQSTHLMLKLTPIVSNQCKIGYTLLFEDISAIRQSEIKLKEQNSFLIQANEKLTHYVKIAGALEAEEERLLILKQLQSSLIEKIEASISMISHIRENSFINETHKPDIKDLSDMLRNIYKDVRASVSRIAGKEVTSHDKSSNCR
jgi:hypothetical protein